MAFKIEKMTTCPTPQSRPKPAPQKGKISTPKASFLALKKFLKKVLTFASSSIISRDTCLNSLIL